MKKYYSSERLKEITYTNEIQHDLCIYDRKNHNKVITLIHDMDLKINKLQQRIDKTVEYITSNDELYYGDELYEEYQHIINILKGDE